MEGGNTRASLGSTVSVQVGLALQPQHLPCEGTCASLVPCSHPVQAPVFPTRNSCLLCPFDTRACATTLMLFFSAKDFPADKMVLGSGKRLLGFVPSHRDSLLSAPLRVFCLETKLCSTRVCSPDQDQANQDPPELLPLYQVVPCRKILVLV